MTKKQILDLIAKIEAIHQNDINNGFFSELHDNAVENIHSDNPNQPTYGSLKKKLAQMEKQEANQTIQNQKKIVIEKEKKEIQQKQEESRHLKPKELNNLAKKDLENQLWGKDSKDIFDKDYPAIRFTDQGEIHPDEIHKRALEIGAERAAVRKELKKLKNNPVIPEHQPLIDEIPKDDQENYEGMVPGAVPPWLNKAHQNIASAATEEANKPYELYKEGNPEHRIASVGKELEALQKRSQKVQNNEGTLKNLQTTVKKDFDKAKSYDDNLVSYDRKNILKEAKEYEVPLKEQLAQIREEELEYADQLYRNLQHHYTKGGGRNHSGADRSYHAVMKDRLKKVDQNHRVLLEAQKAHGLDYAFNVVKGENENVLQKENLKGAHTKRLIEGSNRVEALADKRRSQAHDVIDRDKTYTIEKAIEDQRDLDYRFQNFLNRRDHAKRQIGWNQDILKGLPREALSPNTAVVQPPIQTSDQSVYGNILGGLGKAFLPKAEGDSVQNTPTSLIHQAFSNAVTNNIGPLQSLMNLIKAPHEGLQGHAEGDSVSPIQRGASMAHDQYEQSLMKRIEALQKKQERSGLHKAVDAIGEALSNSGRPALERFGKTIAGVGGQDKAEIAANEARADKASLLESDLLKGRREEAKNKRHEEIEHQKAKAQEAHYKAMEAHHAASGRGRDPLIAKIEFDEAKKANTDKHQYLGSARDEMNAAYKINSHLDRIETLAKQIDLGGVGSYALKNLPAGEKLYQAFGPNTVAKIDEYKQAIAHLVRDIETSTTGLHSKARQKLLQDSKMAYDMPFEGVKSIVDSMRQLNQEVLDKSLYGIQKVEKESVSPTQADILFHRQKNQGQTAMPSPHTHPVAPVEKTEPKQPSQSKADLEAELAQIEAQLPPHLRLQKAA